MNDLSHAATPDRPRGVLRAAGAVGVCLAAAVAATWPLATRLTSHVVLGTEHEATIPLFGMWNLWWTADRIPELFRGYLNAPFFYPNPGVTTYSEPMPFVGALVAPLWALGAPPPLTYNVALLAVLVLNGAFVYRVARALSVPIGAALLGAVTGVALPLTANLSGVLPNVCLFGMLWTLDGLIRFGRTGNGAWAGWAAAGYVVTFLTFQQYALFFAPAALGAGLVAGAEQGWSRAAVARLGTAGLLTALLVLVIALPARRVHEQAGGFQRPAEVVHALSATPLDYATRPSRSLLALPPRGASDTSGLFPGVVLTTLALVGGVTAWRHPRRRRWVAVFAAIAAFGFVLSLGPRLSVAGWSPYNALRAVVPAVGQVRSPYRAAALTQLCLPVLASLALAGIRRPSRRTTAAVMIGVSLLAAAENLSVPAALLRVPRDDRSQWAAWLRAQPDRDVLVHVPFPDGLTVADYEVETRRMLAQTAHGKPLVNGYSGLFPVARDAAGRVFEAYTAFQLAMAREFPNADLLCILGRGVGADTIVVDRDWAQAHASQLADHSSFLSRVYSDSLVQIYALGVPPGACDG